MSKSSVITCSIEIVASPTKRFFKIIECKKFFIIFNLENLLSAEAAVTGMVSKINRN